MVFLVQLASRVQRAAAIAKSTNTKITFTLASTNLPALATPGVQETIGRAAEAAGLKTMRLPSGAGHDAQDMAHVAPMAMIFVPSQDGISHAPQEYTAPADIANGTDVLLRTLLAIDRGLPRP